MKRLLIVIALAAVVCGMLRVLAVAPRLLGNVIAALWVVGTAADLNDKAEFHETGEPRARRARAPADRLRHLARGQPFGCP